MNKRASKLIKIRLVALIILILASLTGIASRKWGAALPPFLASYTGDTMWALACFSIFRGLFPRLRLWIIFVISTDCSFLIELSQLWHPAFLDLVRQNLVGGLIFGFGFRWTDLLCYVSL